jgi:hypothetical protein
MTRTGKFTVRADQLAHPDFIQVLAQLQFVPYSVRHVGYCQEYEYIGTSPQFEEIEVFGSPLEYEVWSDVVEGEVIAQVRRMG